MSSFDYNAPAELFLSKPTKGSRTKYRRFATAAEALRYAVEDLRITQSLRHQQSPHRYWLLLGPQVAGARRAVDF
jgi:hypothetical protein